MTSTAWGFGLATYDSAGTVLDVWFPEPALGAAPDDATVLPELSSLEGTDDVRGVRREVRRVEIADLAAAPASAEDVWLRLHLLSARLVAPSLSTRSATRRRTVRSLSSS